MTVAIARVIMVVELLAQDVAVAISMVLGFAFLADKVEAGHEGDSLSVQSLHSSSSGGCMGLSKNIVYRYADNLWSDELEVDAFGGLVFKKGDILERRGKHWQIDSIEWAPSGENLEGIPTLWISLVNARVN